jgi:isoquinoline 1-oxidoreductase subunit beta
MGKLRTIARRTLLTGVVVLAGGFAVGYYYYNKEVPNPLLADRKDGEGVFNPFVKIDASGKITVIAPRAEMGQGVSTTLAAFVAEELDVPLSMITVEHGPPSAAYGNFAAMKEGAPYPDFNTSMGANAFRSFGNIAAKMLSIQITGGSSSTYDLNERMRHAGALAREMLKAAAAQKLGVATSTLTTADGKVTDPASGKSLSYGELAEAAAKVEPPKDVELRDPKDWKILGKLQQRVDMLAKVTGAPIFGIDTVQPDMLFATVRINPKLFAPMTSFDASAAKTVKGVVEVVEIKTLSGHGFAVIATNTWAAFKGADAVKVVWGNAVYPKTSEEISKLLADNAKSGEGFTLRDEGDVVAGLAREGTLVEAEYSVPYLAHACMEPMNATAQFKDGQLDIWSPNQAPGIIRYICASEAGVESDKVRVHTTSLGGGFGRRGEIDFSVYATLVAMKTSGKPVKVTWTREEDLTHGAYRPANAASFKARLGSDGMPVAVHGRIAAPSILKSLMARVFPSISMMGPDRSIVDGAFNQPYGITNYRIDGVQTDINIPAGFWRSVGNSGNGFFHESFMDEVAVAGKVDPIELRLRLFEGHPVPKGVVMKVAELSNWKTPSVAGRAKGFAFTDSFGTAVGIVIEVADTPAGIKIEYVWAVADVGRAFDPDIIKAQISSAVIFGLSAAMKQEITFAGGQAQQRNFNDYDAMRIWQAPKFDIAILETREEIGGIGEPGLPPAAPALANAIFALTGKRIRHLPMSREVQFA